MELITAGIPASMSLPTAEYGTGNPDINLGELKSEMLGHGRSLETITLRNIRYYDYTDT